MPCWKPIIGYYSKHLGASGKRGITFQRGLSLSGIPLPLPCGRCTGCRLEHSRQWAMRCMHEKRLHGQSSFVTLTFDRKHLPANGSVDKRMLQLFMKRLRKALPVKIRFYACGEYGEQFGRPHYHLIIFGFDFPDKIFLKKSKTGEDLFYSPALAMVWKYGTNVIGDVTFDSAAYVARYIMKKITGAPAADHYQGRVPEFTVMSRKPGIGKGWYELYGSETYLHDSVIFKGREMRPPRYYDTLFEGVDSDRLLALKLMRRRLAAKPSEDKSPERRRVRETVEIKSLAMWKRDVS